VGSREARAWRRPGKRRAQAERLLAKLVGPRATYEEKDVRLLMSALRRASKA